MDYCRKSLWQQNFVHHDNLLTNKHSFYSFWILNTIIDVKTINTRGYYLCIICCGIKGEISWAPSKTPWLCDDGIRSANIHLFLCFRTRSCSTVFRNHKYTLHIIFSVLQINIIGNFFSCKYWNILPLYLLMKCSWSLVYRFYKQCNALHLDEVFFVFYFFGSPALWYRTAAVMTGKKIYKVNGINNHNYNSCWSY